MNVLVIEDEEVLLEMLMSSLKRAGINATGAQSPFEVAKALEGPEKYTMVLSDHHVENVSGVGLAIEFQKKFPQLIIAFMSGESSGFIRQEFVRLGGQGDIKVFEKPFNRRELINWILEQNKQAS